MAEKELEIVDLHVSVEGQEILKGLNLEVEKGAVEVIMGPNGSGKSTLAHTIMGHPKYQITSGKILFRGEDITHLKPYERARKGLFLAFQYPHEVEGVPLGRFLWRAASVIREADTERDIPDNPGAFNEVLRKGLEALQLDKSFRSRDLNLGFSGGEKKRAEIVQMLALKPRLAVLDEIDSGLDIDSIKLVASAIERYRNGASFLIITHYQRILDYVKPDRIHVMIDGQVVLSGGPELARELEEKGYEWLREKRG